MRPANCGSDNRLGKSSRAWFRRQPRVAKHKRQPPSEIARGSPMPPMPPDGFQWPADWEPIPDDDTCLGYPRLTAEAFGDDPPADTLAQELHREVSPAHPLYRVS